LAPPSAAETLAWNCAHHAFALSNLTAQLREMVWRRLRRRGAANSGAECEPDATAFGVNQGAKGHVVKS
jgi:hypothetical protein